VAAGTRPTSLGLEAVALAIEGEPDFGIRHTKIIPNAPQYPPTPTTNQLNSYSTFVY